MEVIIDKNRPFILPTMRNVRDWYVLSQTERRRFLADLDETTPDRLVALVQDELHQPPVESLRTLEDIANYTRIALPSLAELEWRKPNEQTLQYRFMHRGYFRHLSEKVLAREYPSSDRRDKRSAVVDLLAFEQERRNPLIVELKRAEATDPLFGVVVEALHHWAFLTRNCRLLASVLQRAGHDCPDTCSVQLAIAAPDRYKTSTKDSKSLEAFHLLAADRPDITSRHSVDRWSARLEIANSPVRSTL